MVPTKIAKIKTFSVTKINVHDSKYEEVKGKR
jgi:hypothetical protein